MIRSNLLLHTWNHHRCRFPVVPIDLSEFLIKPPFFQPGPQYKHNSAPDSDGQCSRRGNQKHNAPQEDDVGAVQRMAAQRVHTIREEMIDARNASNRLPVLRQRLPYDGKPIGKAKNRIHPAGDAGGVELPRRKEEITHHRSHEYQKPHEYRCDEFLGKHGSIYTSSYILLSKLPRSICRSVVLPFVVLKYLSRRSASSLERCPSKNMSATGSRFGVEIFSPRRCCCIRRFRLLVDPT